MGKIAHGYRVIDLVCGLGPSDPVNENQFKAFRVAAVVRGTFCFRSSLGDGVPIAGSLVIGNACGGYACRHPTPGGDRCLAFDFSAEFLEEVRAGLRFRGLGEGFRRALLPPSPRSVAISSVAEVLASRGDFGAVEEAALELAAAALAMERAEVPAGRSYTFNDERRIARAARYIEAHFDESCTLSELASEAGMSRYHFLRVFRRLTGQTPHRYVLATRLRHAARRLLTTTDRIIDIATAAGFGDLSNFNAAFSQAFGTSPTAFRQRRG